MEIQKIGQLPFLEKQRRRQIDKELILKFFKHERYVFFHVFNRYYRVLEVLHNEN